MDKDIIQSAILRYNGKLKKRRKMKMKKKLDEKCIKLNRILFFNSHPFFHTMSILYTHSFIELMVLLLYVVAVVASLVFLMYFGLTWALWGWRWLTFEAEHSIPPSSVRPRMYHPPLFTPQRHSTRLYCVLYSIVVIRKGN